jgi:hypothetical protein
MNSIGKKGGEASPSIFIIPICKLGSMAGLLK